MTGFQLFGVITLFSTVALILVCLFLYARIQLKRHFRCPYCGERFKVSSTKSFFAARDGVDKKLICPYCGKLGYMEYKHDEDFIQEQKEETLRKESANNTAPDNGVLFKSTKPLRAGLRFHNAGK